MSKIIEDWVNSLATKTPLVSGTVQSVTSDATTGRQMYATVNVGSSYVRVALDGAQRLAQYDTVRLRQIGSAAAAEYGLDSVFGPRPNADLTQFLVDTTVGGFLYAAGDMVMGSYTGPNWWFDFDVARWYSRVGEQITGYDDANGDRAWGPPDDMHFFYDASEVALLIRNGTDEIARIAGDTLSIIGFQRLGAPIGPCIEWGHVLDVDANGDAIMVGGTQQKRFFWRILGENGAAVISMTSGTDTSPNDASLTIGYAGAESRLEWRDGRLTVRGAIYADVGTLGNFTIQSDRLASVNGRVALIGEASDDFGEGLSLVAGPLATAGAIKWYEAAGSNWATGIDFCYTDAVTAKAVKQSQVSDAHTEEAILRHVAGDKVIELSSVNGLDLSQTGSVKVTSIYGDLATGGANISGYTEEYLLDAGDVVQYNSDGLAARVTKLSTGNGVVAQLLLNTDTMVQLRLPLRRSGAGSIYLTGLYFVYSKAITGAYFPYVRLVQYDHWTDTKSYLVELADVGSGAAAANYTVNVVTTPLQITNVGPVYLVLTSTGIVTGGDLRFIFGGVSYEVR